MSCKVIGRAIVTADVDFFWADKYGISPGDVVKVLEIEDEESKEEGEIHINTPNNRDGISFGVLLKGEYIMCSNEELPQVEDIEWI